MNIKDLRQFVQEIVKKASNLKDKYTSEKKAPVNYACIFCQNEEGGTGEIMTELNGIKRDIDRLDSRKNADGVKCWVT